MATPLGGLRTLIYPASDLDAAKAWLVKGAVASDRVHKFLAKNGLVKARVHANPQKAQPKKKAQERAAAAAKAAEEAPAS